MKKRNKKITTSLEETENKVDKILTGEVKEVIEKDETFVKEETTEKIDKLVYETSEIEAKPCVLYKECKVLFELDDNKYKPIRATKGSAAMDVKAKIEEGAKILLQNEVQRTNGTLKPNAKIIKHNDKPTLVLAVGDRVKIPTGIKADIPENWEIGVYSRSGIALKQGLIVVNGVATIDSDYTQEIHVIVQNIGQSPIKISDGDRIAQIKFKPVTILPFEIVEKLEKTTDRKGGFGSTGK